ncbi:hypothetical protein [Microbacterium sp. NC79]|uniref:hypothetical protein n=1 Tax=Microbacterium sp. NC79 TaxID=2851009 RepID=UPI001C2C988B|nr:hypothetical protein [Microbacterium sp. NC79]MBV0896094.1 hypothetical protein [Microbacterium sp. NC79]
MAVLSDDERLIKSRQRVKAHGEVFTPRQMVDQMLDLVSLELESGPGFVDKTFLEPAAGDGNFLVAILQRKLRAIEKTIQPEEWVTESLFALASIYAVEFLEDNHAAAQATLLSEFAAFHKRAGNACGAQTNLYRSARTLIESNIICGNTLTGLDVRGEEIQFSWWHRVPNEAGMVQREPFTFASLREGAGGNGMFDFTTYETYAVCRIDHVYDEVRADG